AATDGGTAPTKPNGPPAQAPAGSAQADGTTQRAQPPQTEQTAQRAQTTPTAVTPSWPSTEEAEEEQVTPEGRRIRSSPLVHTIYEVEMPRVVKLRAKLKNEWERRNATKLTFMPFIARATTAAIRQYPIVNSSVEGDNIHYHRNINLGIAVALDWGLIVPVIKKAEELNFLGLQRAINDLSERARTKRLNPDDVMSGTFTITNPGSIGGLIGMPII